jgi:hypothetical protein
MNQHNPAAVLVMNLFRPLLSQKPLLVEPVALLKCLPMSERLQVLLLV